MINEIMFAISIDISNTDPFTYQHAYADYPLTIYSASIHFKTRWLYMVGAIILHRGLRHMHPSNILGILTAGQAGQSRTLRDRACVPLALTARPETSLLIRL